MEKLSGEEDVQRLLRIGTVAERSADALRIQSDKGARGVRARQARETLDILAAGGYASPADGSWVDLKHNQMMSISLSRYYPAGAAVAGSHASPETPLECSSSSVEMDLRCEVKCCSTIAAALELASQGLTPGVLNFASARNPGGGFTTGAEGQEEACARSSAIYPCLSKHFEAFYIPRRNEHGGLYSHDIIFSPAVPVLRDAHGSLLLAEPLPAAHFVTAAAPNYGVLQRELGDKAASVEAETALRERIGRVLEVFWRNGVQDVVLGAWGCGVFRNDPLMVASLFKEHLEGDFRCHFRHVIFAILDPAMAEVFASCFAADCTDSKTSEGQQTARTSEAPKQQRKGRWRASGHGRA
mmetsp:Transcript_26169/g.61030  ORF Transcript_26169/g.61030 Transcript_26169/m.61030 type:complete len:356 (-) Transcript_26169:88-1155(-)